MKIKRNVKKNLPQLIEWAWDNGVRNVTFRGLDKKGYVVSISINDKGEFTSDWRISKNGLFTVEVEEEITEDTVIPTLVTKNINGDYNEWTDRSVKDFVLAHMEAIYIPNSDLSMTLIWRDGRLIE